MFGIERASYYVPPQCLQIEQSLERFSLNKIQAKVFAKIYGLEQVPIAPPTTIVELIKLPIQQLLDESDVDKRDIKIIIHSHTGKVITRFGRSVIRGVQQELNLKHTLVFGTTLNNCA